MKLRSVLIVFIGCVLAMVGPSAVAQTAFEKGKALYDQKKFEEAIPFFTSAVSEKKQEGKALAYRGDSYANIRKATEAKIDLDMARNLDPALEHLDYFFGRYYLLTSDPKNAEQSFSAAIARDDKDDQSYDGRAIAKAMLKNYKASVADSDIAIRLNATDNTFFNNRGYVKLQMDMTEEALADFDASIKLSPNSKAFANIGSIYYKEGRYTKAIDNFSKGIWLRPDDPELLYYRALCFNKLEKFNEACADFVNSKAVCDKVGYKISNLDDHIKELNCF